jgi:hypothetical protein
VSYDPIHGIQDWHCARCGRRSGMMGHSGSGEWSCESVPGFDEAARARCEAHDRRFPREEKPHLNPPE